MLALISKTSRKKTAQQELKRNLKNALKPRGIYKIGFLGGNESRQIYAAGEGKLWVAFGESKSSGKTRYLNLFGVYEPDLSQQISIVEINIPIDDNRRNVAGFFAEDKETGDIFLMHDGGVGGGRAGIGKSAFLACSKHKLIEIAEDNGKIRIGIAVGRLQDRDLSGRILAFVESVQSFKEQVANGVLKTPEFKRQVEDFDSYSKEFSGKKQGIRDRRFEYITYHGDIVQKLYDERHARLLQGEEVSNSKLIDLFVKKDGVISEVYEMKTGNDRQMLYTAIGQVLTHGNLSDSSCKRFIVLPESMSVPDDIMCAIKRMNISLIQFKIRKGKVWILS